jgi:hypothetical protein
MDALPLVIQTAYAELLEQLTTLEARRSIGHLSGSFVTKEIKGKAYYYFQASIPGGRVRQIYLGPRTRELDALAARYVSERDALREDRARIASLCAVLRTGAAVTDAASARVIAALADAGVFRLGGVLVGTHAFVVLGNMLGVRWFGAHARTEDVDIAASRVLEVAVPELRADVPKVLESLNMGFLPVPRFSPTEPSTSFNVRGRGLRVDLVTPATSRSTKPVHVARFNVAAAPLPYLDFVLREAQPAAVIDGGGILVRVPHPARFAVHKLIVAQDRPAALQTKRDKDLVQAALLIEALEQLRPGEIRAAWDDARGRGPGWARALQRGEHLLERAHPEATSMLKSLRG